MTILVKSHSHKWSEGNLIINKNLEIGFSSLIIVFTKYFYWEFILVNFMDINYLSLIINFNNW